MKWPWSKSKRDYPEFWIEYLETFEKEQSKLISETNFVVFDTETTGLDYKQDRILSLGAIKVENLHIMVSESLEVFVEQNRFNPETVEIHGILKNEYVEQLSELDAIKQFLVYIKNSVLVGHHVIFDITMINKILKRNGLPRLKNKSIDTVSLYRKTKIKSNLIDVNKNISLDELAYEYDIDQSDRHTAAGDAFITSLAFIRIVNKLKGSNKLELAKLLQK